MAIGRCWSVDQLALPTNRNIGFCMSMDQASGLAAAMVIKDGVTLHGIDVITLQDGAWTLIPLSKVCTMGGF